MMSDKRYRGSSSERDPGFIAEIDAWWIAQAKLKEKK
jgi:hypothetical protein